MDLTMVLEAILAQGELQARVLDWLGKVVSPTLGAAGGPWLSGTGRDPEKAPRDVGRLRGQAQVWGGDVCVNVRLARACPCIVHFVCVCALASAFKTFGRDLCMHTEAPAVERVLREPASLSVLVQKS